MMNLSANKEKGRDRCCKEAPSPSEESKSYSEYTYQSSDTGNSQCHCNQSNSYVCDSQGSKNRLKTGGHRRGTSTARFERKSSVAIPGSKRERQGWSTTRSGTRDKCNLRKHEPGRGSTSMNRGCGKSSRTGDATRRHIRIASCGRAKYPSLSLSTESDTVVLNIREKGKNSKSGVIKRDRSFYYDSARNKLICPVCKYKSVVNCPHCKKMRSHDDSRRHTRSQSVIRPRVRFGTEDKRFVKLSAVESGHSDLLDTYSDSQVVMRRPHHRPMRSQSMELRDCQQVTYNDSYVGSNNGSRSGLRDRTSYRVFDPTTPALTVPSPSITRYRSTPSSQLQSRVISSYLPVEYTSTRRNHTARDSHVPYMTRTPLYDSTTIFQPSVTVNTPTYRKEPFTYREGHSTYRNDPYTYRKDPLTYRKDPLTYRKDPLTYRKPQHSFQPSYVSPSYSMNKSVKPSLPPLPPKTPFGIPAAYTSCPPRPPPEPVGRPIITTNKTEDRRSARTTPTVRMRSRSPSPKQPVRRSVSPNAPTSAHRSPTSDWPTTITKSVPPTNDKRTRIMVNAETNTPNHKNTQTMPPASPRSPPPTIDETVVSPYHSNIPTGPNYGSLVRCNKSVAMHSTTPDCLSHVSTAATTSGYDIQHSPSRISVPRERITEITTEANVMSPELIEEELPINIPLPLENVRYIDVKFPAIRCETNTNIQPILYPRLVEMPIPIEDMDEDLYYESQLLNDTIMDYVHGSLANI